MILKGPLIVFLPFVQFLDNFFLCNIYYIHNYIWYGKIKDRDKSYAWSPYHSSWGEPGKGDKNLPFTQFLFVCWQLWSMNMSPVFKVVGFSNRRSPKCKPTISCGAHPEKQFVPILVGKLTNMLSEIGDLLRISKANYYCLNFGIHAGFRI